ncbi:AT-rich interactive domain protein [Melia azedarach]|nr:AT-rich interactive domain protein [Melia azedarach]
MVAEGSVLDCVQTTSKQKNLEPNEFRVDLELLLKESEPSPEKLRRCFDQLLQIFLEKICARDSYRPLPPLLGDEQSVDLFKLFLVVRRKGGYGTVSKDNLWDLVTIELGLDSSFSPLVKLVYVKYLNALEGWLGRGLLRDIKDTKSGSSLSGYLMELGPKFKVFLSDSKKRDRVYPHLENVNSELNFVNDVNVCKNDVIAAESGGSEKFVNDEESITKGFSDSTEVAKFCDDGEVKSMVVDLEGDKNGYDAEVNSRLDDVDITKCVVNSSDFRGEYNDEEVKNALVVELKGGKKCVENGQEDAMIVDSSAIEEKKESLSHSEKSVESSSHKRRQESMQKMLSWITGIAKDPCNSVVGSLPDKSKWKCYGNEELWKQVLSYREALFLKRQVDSSGEQSIGQKNQKMHPGMYDDHIGTSYNLRERLSCCKKTFQAGASPKSSSAGTQSDSCKGGMENHDDKELLQTSDSSTAESVFDYDVEKPIPVGPSFQAEVPEWTGVPSESDFKWLGTQVWPLQKVEHKFFIERDPIGKGRQESCGCQFRGSIECVRFHIAERRYRLKLELGSAFHNWKFDKMGEEVMLSWSEEEQKKFKTIVRSNPPSLYRCFWDQIFKSFPYKSREELVSYYFNVFLLQRRAHQNRLTPDNVDSDDDYESESGFSTKSLGHETKKSPSSIFHSPNKKHKRSR